jgi:hypothetical protein
MNFNKAKGQFMANTNIRLKVPSSLSFMDKTPTPTRLLRAVDEIGLFRDDEKLLCSAKSTCSNNPFDETFRKALSSQDVATTSTCKAANKDDDMLNTPQIISFHDLFSAPPSANVILPTPVHQPLPPPQHVSSLRPIVPNIAMKTADGSKSTEAQLLLRMPTGQTFQLSKLPFIRDGVNDHDKDHDPLAVVCEEKKKGRKRPLKDGSEEAKEATNELKERNRAAALRSRQKKKVNTSKMQERLDQMLAANKRLLVDNQKLGKEVSRLNYQLEHCKCVQQVIQIDSNQWIPAAEESEQQQQRNAATTIVQNHTFIRVTPNAGPSLNIANACNK